jgi:hypothetical protein
LPAQLPPERATVAATGRVFFMSPQACPRPRRRSGTLALAALPARSPSDRSADTGKVRSVGVLGAAAVWLPTYQTGRLRPMYLGDEAVVDGARGGAPSPDSAPTAGVPW